MSPETNKQRVERLLLTWALIVSFLILFIVALPFIILAIPCVAVWAFNAAIKAPK